MVFFALVFGSCISFALASPNVALPINSQVPPIAQVDQPFHYEFAPDTFQSSSGDKLAYSLQTAPPWLQLDSDSRILSGTPAASDVGPFTFQLSATDGHGVADSQVVFMVVDGTIPSYTGDTSAILARSGLLSGPTSLLLMPETEFNITLDRDKFHGDGALFFYATSTDRSPLPSWVIFDADTISLSGITPSPAAAPRSYGLRILASSIEGFAEVDVELSIEISNHELYFKDVEQKIQVTAGQMMHVDMGSSLILDGQVISKEQIARAQVTGSSWITFDQDSMTLIGQAPLQTTHEEVEISVWDQFDDMASMVLQLSVSAGQSSLTKTTETTQASTANIQSSSGSTGAPKTQSGGQGIGPQTPALVQGGTRRLSAGQISAIVIVPVLFVVLLIGLCICLRRRRQRQAEATSEEELPGPANGGNHAQRRRLGYHTSWLPPLTGQASPPVHDDMIHATALPKMQDRAEDVQNFSRPHTDAGRDWNVVTAAIAEGRGQRHHPLQSHPDTGTAMSHSSKRDTFRTDKSDGTIPVSDMAVVEDGVVVWPRPRSLSVMARVLPGAGHGRAPIMRHSDSTCSYYGSTNEDFGTGRSSRGSATQQIMRRSTLKFQRLSTIRKVVSSSETSASSAPRSFGERRQSFINRRASNPNRPLFSAGHTEMSKASSETTRDLEPASVRALQLQVNKPDFNARYHQGAMTGHGQEGYTQAGSLESLSSVWEDIDTNSMDSPDADHGSMLIAEDASRSWLEAERPSAGNMTASPQPEATVRSSQDAEGDSVAFL